jgi:hypothetical protein
LIGKLSLSLDIENQLRQILTQYKTSFSEKVYQEENEDYDVLMDVFGITPSLKRENRQYWGRELGICWQMLVCKLFEIRCADFQPALKIDGDEPCDCIVGKDAIDTKYRIGSGDSGTLKKFKQYGEFFKQQGLNPVLLIVREDNLPAAITACKTGGWSILIGNETFEYIFDKTDFNLYAWLKSLKNEESLNIER